ncbi:MAG: AAA family ATPase [Deltaproteobacteria bacterium]|nr:AAA family ATPase [Deltaproteobacteria bacterium]
MDLTIFFEEQQKLIRRTSLKNKRYLYEKIKWKDKCIAILGQRGVGKTTLMLQYLKEFYSNSPKALYIAADNPYFKAISLYEFAQQFEKLGGEILFIDEIHKYDDWSSHIKSIYDMTELKIAVSGSSMLKIHKQKADLSRRMKVYRLANLSFREYLEFIGVIKKEPVKLEEILQNHIEIASEISLKIKPLQYFKDYVKFGCYPFIAEGKELYGNKLTGIINQILENDLPYITNIDFSRINKIKKLVYLIAVSAPFSPNITELSRITEISRPTLLEYLYYLELASVINTASYKGRGYGKLEKPDKIFLYNTNIASAITKSPNAGNIRETFFINQLKSFYYDKKDFLNEDILLSKNGDFLIENSLTVEIGGKNKFSTQIKNIKNAYIAADDIEIGFGNKIPLWLFGFLY